MFFFFFIVATHSQRHTSISNCPRQTINTHVQVNIWLVWSSTHWRVNKHSDWLIRCRHKHGAHTLKNRRTHAEGTKNTRAHACTGNPVWLVLPHPLVSGQNAPLIACLCLLLSFSSERTPSRQRWRPRRVLRASAGRHSSLSPVTPA